MNKADKRAIRIVELQEDLEKAKEIIKQFIWMPDFKEGQLTKFKQSAARFAGCLVPIQEGSPEAHEKAVEEQERRL